jgi:uncharacterized protein (DUF1501 family)
MASDWWSCDGYRRGRIEAGTSAAIGVTRRSVLAGLALGSIGWLSSRTALSQVAVSPNASPEGDVLVVIFLRGGADGLNMVVPFGEDAYHRARPSLGLGPPRDAARPSADRCLDLDGFFGLNPPLAPLLPLYGQGAMAIVHACGSGDQTRSHFEAMSAMERGLATADQGDASGWLSRYLAATQGGPSTPLRAVSFSATMPDSLRGATEASALRSVDDFRLMADGSREAAVRNSLSKLYGGGKDAMAAAGRDTLAVLETLNRLSPAGYKPSNGAAYPASDLGQALRQVAFLVRAGVGMEVACLEKGGWDTHVVQGASSGLLTNLLDDLGKSVAAFAQDLGQAMGRVTVVVQTEFGRRLQENSGLGTDHGRASVMFVLGGGTNGGKVYGDWPGLEANQLEEPGDLRVTTDYRDVLDEVVQRRMRPVAEGSLFEGHQAKPIGMVV